jgi:hypothetical protein
MKTPELVTKYFSFPFVYDDSCYIWDDKHNMCMTKVHGDDEFFNLVVGLLNGTESRHPQKEFIFKDGKISTDGKTVLIIRGWGRLQYIEEDNPELIQDTFGQWVTDMLNNK